MTLQITLNDGGFSVLENVGHAKFEGDFFNVYDCNGRANQFISKDKIAKIAFFYCDVEECDEDDDECDKLIDDKFIDWLKDDKK